MHEPASVMGVARYFDERKSLVQGAVMVCGYVRMGMADRFIQE